jgi:histidine triad (HIT) family protein
MRPDSAECLFCSIVDADEVSSRVYEDATVLAFMDLHPVNPGHTLVVPKRHAAGLMDLDEELGIHMWRVGHRLARALRRTDLRCEGVNVFVADGEAAFQEIFHVHLHVFPRFTGDTFRIDAEWQRRERAELDDTATTLATALSQLTP